MFTRKTRKTFIFETTIHFHHNKIEFVSAICNIILNESTGIRQIYLCSFTRKKT